MERKDRTKQRFGNKNALKSTFEKKIGHLRQARYFSASDSEYELIKENAKLAGKKIGDFIRIRAMDREPSSPPAEAKAFDQ